MKDMGTTGHLPKFCATCEPPKCHECIYGKQTRCPWRTGKTRSRIAKDPAEPGNCVSVDQLESPTPGLVGQAKGTLTNARLRVATIFVDHATCLDYVHVQRSTSSEDTLEANHAFEIYAASHGVKIVHYHADNRRFANNAFIKDIKDSGQSISYCAVGAHHQNGIAEKRIRDLVEQA